MKTLMQTGLRGQQNIQVLKKGKVIRETGFQKNLVLDNYFNDMTSESTPNYLSTSLGYQCVVVGTGSTAPAPSQTNLATYLAGKIGSDGSMGVTYLGVVGGKAQYRFRRTWTFNEGAVNGNVSEIGTKNTSNPGTLSTMSLHTRALVLDVSNNPTSIPVGAGEQLRVIHDFLFEIDLTRFSQTMDVTTSGVTTSHLVEMEWANISNGYTYSSLVFDSSTYRGSGGSNVLVPVYAYSSLEFNASYGSPDTSGGVTSFVTKVLTQPFGVLSARLTCTLPSTEGNAPGGIGGFMLGGNSPSASPLFIKFTPPVPKNTLNKLVIALDFINTRL